MPSEGDDQKRPQLVQDIHHHLNVKLLGRFLLPSCPLPGSPDRPSQTSRITGR